MEFRHLLYTVLMWIICTFAIFRGRPAERLVALALLIGSILTPLVSSGLFRHVETRIVIVDILVFVVFFTAGLFSQRYWTLWVTAIQGVGMLGHLLPLMPLSSPWVYANAISLWAWPILFLLARATLERPARPRVSSASPG